MERRHERGPSFPPRSPIRWAACAVIIIIGAVSLGTVLMASWRPVLENTDFAQDYASSKAWTSGADPYADTPTLIRTFIGNDIALWPHPYSNPHPPAQILTAAPLQTLSFRVANATWVGSLAIAFVASLWVVFSRLGLSGATSATLAMGALALPTVRFALKNGEPNAYVLVLLVLAWAALARGKQGWAGAALGIATAVRIFPILLLIPLLRERRWRAAVSQIAVAFSITVVTFAVFGHLGRFLTSLRESDAYWRAAGHNISLVSIPFRWLSGNPWFTGGARVPALAATLFVLLLIACVVAIATTPGRAGGDLLWAAVPWMLLAAPLAWADYLIIAFPCAALIIYRNKTRLPILFPAILFSALIAIGRPFFVYSVYPVSASVQLFGLALPTYGLLGLGLIELLPRSATNEHAMTATSNGLSATPEAVS